MNYTEFAQKIKTKYPDYADMDDRTLAEKMVAKYPNDYGDVTFDEAQPAQEQPTATPMEAAGSAIKNLFMPENPAMGALEYSPLPTQAKANAGLGMANALTFGGAEAGLRALSPTLPEPTTEQKAVGETAAALVPGEAITGAVGNAAKTAGNVFKVMTKETPYIKKVAGLIRKPFVAAGEKLGSAIDAIDATAKTENRTLSLRETVQNAAQLATENPAVGASIRRSPTLRNLMEHPELAENVSARTAQDIVNELKGTASMQAKLAGNAKAMPLDIDVMDLVGQIRKEQLQAYPELKEAFKDYGKVASNYWKVKNLANADKATGFMLGKTSGMGNAPVRDAVKELSPEAYRMAKDFSTAKTVVPATGKVAATAAGGAVAYDIIRKLLGR